MLNDLVNENDTDSAIKAAKTGSAAGIDGIPYELWKTIMIHHKSTNKNYNDELTFDISKTLTTLFNDIQTHRVDQSTEFTLGWMCPIYKKKERSEIENYRPITLLNTNYKLLTRILAMQLAKEIPSLVHKNQAGFITGRSIFNQTRLAQTMIDLAEATEQNGAIIALDQEKAYDKIEHEYLWTTLQAFNLPERFVNTLKSLYTNAKTQIMINGILSGPLTVQRGTRQGDPISAFVFDLAIEPLACMMRNSTKITRYKIANIRENVIVNLFADDTTVYLNAEDRYNDLQNILDVWCAASGARFNIDKTEIVPIGSLTHREQVITIRKLYPDDPPLSQEIRIAEDSHTVRLLGAWLGNGIDDATPWEPVLDKI